jgi:hypothetical protein
MNPQEDILEPWYLFFHFSIFLQAKFFNKGHNFFFQIYTFLDGDFSILMENRNNFQFSQAVCGQ